MVEVAQPGGPATFNLAFLIEHVWGAGRETAEEYRRFWDLFATLGRGDPDGLNRFGRNGR